MNKMDIEAKTTLLYRKIYSEYEQFRAKTLELDKERILDSWENIGVYVDVWCAFEELFLNDELDERAVDALLDGNIRVMDYICGEYAAQEDGYVYDLRRDFVIGEVRKIAKGARPCP